MTHPSGAPAWRRRLHEIIFESATRAGRASDLLLLGAIIASVVTVMFDSVANVRALPGGALA